MRGSFVSERLIISRLACLGTHALRDAEATYVMMLRIATGDLASLGRRSRLVHALRTFILDHLAPNEGRIEVNDQALS